MKTKQKKSLVLVLLVLVVVGAGGSYGGFKYFAKRRALEWKRDGIAAAQAGDHERAAELLARYVQRYGGDEGALTWYVKSRELVELPNGQHITDTLWGLKALLNIDPD